MERTLKHALLRRGRDIFERISRFDVDSVGKRSIVITDRKYQKSAWASQRCQLRSIIEEFNIDLILDVGANEGQFARQLRKFYKGTIHSFEPVSSTCESLRISAQDDSMWHVHQFALGSQEEQREINVYGRSEFSSLLMSNEYGNTRFAEEVQTVRSERILVRRLDTVLDEVSSGPVSPRIFLKMDTQGFDLEVFRGLGTKLRHVYALQSEISVLPIYKGMPHWTESILTYERAGFSIAGMFPVTRDSLNVIEYDSLLVKPHH